MRFFRGKSRGEARFLRSAVEIAAADAYVDFRAGFVLPNG
jgi:hypothetical protein